MVTCWLHRQICNQNVTTRKPIFYRYFNVIWLQVTCNHKTGSDKICRILKIIKIKI